MLGYVTEEGGPTSHSAILARALGASAAVGTARRAGELAEGTVVAVDGSTGEIFVDPSAEKRAEMEAAAAARKAALSASTGPGATSDGHKVPLLANRRRSGDVPAAVEAGAEGVGLFQYRVPVPGRQQAGSFRGEAGRGLPCGAGGVPRGRVVVRVLDAGADKPLDFLTPADEPNPALGVRGLRSLLDHPEVLRTQLTALAKAAEGLPVYLEVMAPMVADRTDAKAFADACREAGLQAKFGAMVEIPSAALRARSILQEVEFLSLGTNDLAQYTFAADRQVGAVSRLRTRGSRRCWISWRCPPRAARAEGKSCGVCGEAAADPLLACVLTGLGVTSLSMGAASIPYVRATLAKYSLAQCERAANAARSADSADEARSAAQAVLSGE